MTPDEKQQFSDEIIRRIIAIIMPMLHLKLLSEIPPPKKEEKKEKSVEELISYVRYVFAESSEEERSISESVINKFREKYAKRN